ncbi:ATP-grasp domain-containing protein [Ekhidna sp.]
MKDFTILFTDIFSRKTFDLYNVVKIRFPEAECLIASEGGAWDKTKARLIYQGSTNETLLTQNYSEFEESLNKIADTRSDQKIIFLPIEEKTILLFFEYLKNHGSKNFLFSLPDESTFKLVRDKGDLMRFCLENNFPHPTTYKNLLELNKLGSMHPLISKPSVGEGAKGILRFTKDDATIEYFRERVVQDEIEHSQSVIGVFLNCTKGEIRGHYCHQRQRTFPLKGGVTVLSEIVVSDRCLEISKNIVSKLQWNGLIMLEFLFDKKLQDYLLLEINPRLWGSLLLGESELNGLVSNYICGHIEQEFEPKPPSIGSKIRWVWPYDVLYLFTGKISFKEFIARDKTLFVNWTYASKIPALLFTFFSMLDFKKWKNLLKKI